MSCTEFGITLIIKVRGSHPYLYGIRHFAPSTLGGGGGLGGDMGPARLNNVASSDCRGEASAGGAAVLAPHRLSVRVCYEDTDNRCAGLRGLGKQGGSKPRRPTETAYDRREDRL
jgi:hypothetical protein